jgi:hypothetical protein
MVKYNYSIAKGIVGSYTGNIDLVWSRDFSPER